MKTKKTIIASILAMLFTSAHGAQEIENKAVKNTADETEAIEKITVVGTHIRNSHMRGISPVSIIGSDEIEAVGAEDMSEMLNSLSQAGAFQFDGNGPTTVISGINAARGDIQSTNFRDLGSSNTLQLLNGRRLVNHSGFQLESTIPTIVPNSSAIPTGGVKRVEVLWDGAAAIYGSDAVAGVVNTVMKTNVEGVKFTSTVSKADNAGGYRNFSVLAGKYFNDEKTNVSFYFKAYEKDEVMANEHPQSARGDLRPLMVGTPWEGDTELDNRSTHSAWGGFQAYSDVADLLAGGGVRVRDADGNTITDSDGDFHIQPNGDYIDTVGACRFDLDGNICIDDGTQSSSTNRDLRYNWNGERTRLAGLKRYNQAMFVNHEMDDGSELYGELTLYYAKSERQREASASLSGFPITMAKDAYWNPFGRMYMEDGSLNPNRLPGINAPEDGLIVDIERYRTIDGGARETEITNTSFRTLVGMRGELSSYSDWYYDTAFLYSEAETKDLTHNRVSNTLFQQALNRTDDTAYNPFNGGCLTSVRDGDCTPNDQAIVDSFLIDVSKDTKTYLALADFKLSNSNLYDIAAGSIEGAFGVEIRSEGFEEDRDSRLDATTPYTNSVTGITYDTDVMQSSSTPDSDGSREVYSAFAELAFPLVSPSMDIPLVKSLDMSIAGRYEYYEHVGDIARPKLGFAWQVVDDVLVRGSFSKGFKAPSVPTMSFPHIARSSTFNDYYYCLGAIKNGSADFETVSDSNCDNDYEVEGTRISTVDENGIKPETSDSYSLGLVLQPKAIPDLAITVDYWRIDQQNIIGTFGTSNQTEYDFALGHFTGEGNPNIIRSAVTQDDIDFFAGTGLEAVGKAIQVSDPYLNLDERRTAGWDFVVRHRFRDINVGGLDFGSVSLKVAGSRLLESYQEFSAQGLVIDTVPEELSTLEAGRAGNRMGDSRRPKWSGNATVTWSKGDFKVGYRGKYVGAIRDTSLNLAGVSGGEDGSENDYWVPSWYTSSIYAQYYFNKRSVLPGLRVKFQVTDLEDKGAPFMDNSFGYGSRTHSLAGRTYKLTLSKHFD